MLTNELLLKSKHKTWEMFDKVAPTYDLLNKLLSFGIDRYWRRVLSKNISKDHFHLLDLGTGTGDVLFSIVDHHQVTHAIGMDLSEKMMDVARKKSDSRSLIETTEFRAGDATQIPLGDRQIDVISMAFAIRNVSDPSLCLKEMVRVLKEDGEALILEFSLPKHAFIRSIYLFYFRTILPFVGKIISRDKHAYKYLNESVESFPYGDKFVELMKKAGFSSVRYIPLTFGIATLYVGRK